MSREMLLLCFFTILIVGSGLVGYSHFSQPQTKEIAQSFKNQTSNSKIEKKTSQTSNEKKSASTTSKGVKQKKETAKKEIRNFNRTVIEQNYYLEQVNNKGVLTYVKASAQSIEELENKAGTERLGTYQVNHEGQMISVITLPEEK